MSIRRAHLPRWMRGIGPRVLAKLVADTVSKAVKLVLILAVILVAALCVVVAPHLLRLPLDILLVGLCAVLWIALLGAVVRLVRLHRTRMHFYPCERAALARLGRDIARARRSVKVIGHTCANVFVLAQAYESAMRNGADVTVLMPDPDDRQLMCRNVSLEEESLGDLVEMLEKSGGMQQSVAAALETLPEDALSNQVPIVLSLLHGWAPVGRKAKLDQLPGKMHLLLYSDPDCVFRATVIDEDQRCYLGRYGIPRVLRINSRIEVLRDRAEVRTVGDLVREIEQRTTTRPASYQVRQGWATWLTRLGTEYQSLP